MPKKRIIDHYQCALNVLYGAWNSVHPCDCYSEDGNEYPLYADNLHPEQMIIKKEAFAELSNEAKEIITTILHLPGEVFDLITTPKSKNITRRSTKRYFIKKWKSEFIVNLTFEEIADWIAKL